MADISKYLEDILSAIYGEEVRHSIHDAIVAIDNEVYTGVEDAKAEVAKAAAQAANAASSAQSAATSASTASQAATRAGASVTSAANEANRAKTEADKAAGSASSASASASKAAASATLSQSWATGDTASRNGEESNNSKYYAEQAKRALSAISGSLVPMGTIAFEQLPSAPLQPGVMYNISNEFTTDDRFNEGAGHKYGAGTNVYWTGESKWDCLAAPGGTGDDAYSPTNKPEVGGRNYALNTSDAWSDWFEPRTNTDNVTTVICDRCPLGEKKVGDKYTLKFELEFQNVTVGTAGSYGCVIYGPVDDSYVLAVYNIWRGILDNSEPAMSSPPENGVYTFTKVAEITDEIKDANNFSLRFRANYWGDGRVRWRRVKCEKGEIATDWTPAPEDLEITPYISTPLPPSYTGSSGTAEEYARGDHVHPFSDFEFVSRGAVTQDTDWNTVTVSGIYTVVNGKGANHPNVNLLYGVLYVFNRYEYEDVYTIMQIYFPNSGDFVYRMAYNSRIIKLTFGPWYNTASNTSGILPIEKGGTSRNDGASLMVKDYRSNSVLKLLWKGDVDSQEAEGGGILYPVLGMSNAKTSGGEAYGAVTAPYFKKTFSIVSTTDYATTSKAGLVKPGAGLQVSDDGTLSVTGISGDYHVHIVHGVKWDTGHQMLLAVGVDPVTSDVAEFPINALATVTSNYIVNSTQSSIGTLYGVLNVSLDIRFFGTINFQIQTTDNDHSISTAAEVYNLFKRIYPANFQVPATGYWLQSN